MKKFVSGSGSGAFTWEQFWEYIKSDRCTPDMIAETMASLDLPNAIKGSMAAVQWEILQCAPPQYITKEVVAVLHPLVRAELNIPTTDEDISRYVLENWEYLKEK